MNQTNSLESLPGVGEKTAAKLKKLGISNRQNLLTHYPRRYEDYSNIVKIADAKPGKVTVKGVITHVHSRRSRRGVNITKALIDDGSGSVQAVWFNQPYLSNTLPKGKEVFASAELAFAYNSYALQSPSIELVSTFPKNTARIIPIYSETEGISSKYLRRLIHEAMPKKMTDPLPLKIRNEYGLVDKLTALKQIHFPNSMVEAETARRRLAFEELFVLLMAMEDLKKQRYSLEAPQIPFNKETVQQIIDNLNFKLTDSQKKCAWQIIKDMQLSRPMNRLLLGDVGSGKTVVCAIAAAMAAKSGFQTALLVPTVVLADQHLQTLKDILEPLGVPIHLLSGSQKAAERHAVTRQLEDTKPLLCIGTHALLTDGIKFGNLGMVIVDEQHRFGVKQRNRLQLQSYATPHFLSMSATPIPRTLALTVYGDLDISLLKEMPPGRKPVITKVVSNARVVYEHMKKTMKNNGQIYVVCPLISESDKLGVKSVEEEIKQLKQQIPGARIEGLNGRMNNQQKTQIMKNFKDGKVDILVSTTVVEVGLDVINATTIVIEGAQRFGLATLHQLRGRVGRGEAQSYCYLKPTSPGLGEKRLRLLEKYHEGYILAEKDLELRGAGELYGEQQHGLLDMRLVQLTDKDLVNEVKKAAKDHQDIDINSALARLIAQRQKQKQLN